MIPEGWRETNIGEITTSNSLFADGDWVESKDQDPKGSNRLIQLADVGDGSFVNKSNRFMNDEQFSRLNCTKLEKNDILIARMPEPLGRACLFPLEAQRCATVVDVAVIRTSNANHYWLMAMINSSEFRRHIELNASGTTRTRIARGALSKISIGFPPLPEQKKIASILTSVDKAIEKQQSHISKLQDLKKAMMQELLTKGIGHTEFKDSLVGRIPKGWECVHLGSICLLITKGSTPTTSGHAYVDIGVRFYRSINASIDGSLLSLDLKYISNEADQSQRRARLEIGDVIISIVGAKTGRTFFCISQKSELPANINQNIALIRPVKEKLNSSFLKYTIESVDFQHQVDMEITTQAQPSLSLKQVGGFEINLPSIHEQNLIADRLDAASRLIQTRSSRLSSLREVKKALMQDLLTGKVRVKV